jgi:DNA/RNA-binding domain of Phe-tRNA-synthetase-like protein
MKYTINPYVFDKNPNLYFGVIIGQNLKNTNTHLTDDEQLTLAEEALRKRMRVDQLKTHPTYSCYRQALLSFQINPNKYPNSLEAMSKRILKGHTLPRINALVDSCNTIGLNNGISLGGHDLRDIHKDLEVRLTISGDLFIPFGSTNPESVPPGELVFTSGQYVQTRYWLWRQSELGKLTLDSQNVFFQLVGFEEKKEQLMKAIRELETLIVKRFGGKYETYILNRTQTHIEFKTT